MKPASLWITLPLACLCALVLCAAAPAQTTPGLCEPTTAFGPGQRVDVSAADFPPAGSMDAYPGADRLFPGPELVYVLRPQHAELLIIQLAAGSPLSLILLRPAVPDRCRAADAVQFSHTGSLSFTPQPGQLYYLVVDGDAPAAFTLALDCPGCATPRPRLDSVLPASLYAPSSAPALLTLAGAAFDPAAQVRLDGLPLDTLWISPAQLEASLPPDYLQRPGRYQLTVANPGPPLRETAARIVEVVAPPGACPSALLLAPAAPDERSTAAPGSHNRFDAYPGLDAPFPGSEFIYRVETPLGGTATVTAQALPAAASRGSPPPCLSYTPQPYLFVLDAAAGCAPASLVAWGQGAAAWDAAPGASYYVAVESPAARALDFTITFSGGARWPGEGGALAEPRPYFTWPPVDGAGRYTLQLSRRADGRAPFLTLSTRRPFAVPSANLTGALYWTVSAYAGDEKLATLPPWPLTILPAPPAPALAAPADQFLTRGGRLTLQWRAPRLPRGLTFSHYEVQVARDRFFTPPLLVEQIVASRAAARLALDGLPPGAHYYWRVRAVAHQAAGPWSAARVIRAALAAPAAFSPLPNQILIQPQAVFLWDPVPGAESYTLQLSTRPDFKRLLHAVTTAQTSYAYALPKGAPVYWRLRANPRPLDPAASNWTSPQVVRLE